MFEVYAKDYRITIQEIPLGNQGEDMARCLVMDITDAVDEFGSGGTVTVRNKRNGDEMPYMATNVTTVTGADATGRTHTYIKWTLTDVDTAVAGSGFVQADYIIAGVTVKTWVYKYFILPSLGVTGDVPDPYEDILEEITAQVAAVQAAAASAEASAAEAEASATRIISTTQEVVEDWLSDHIVTGYTVDDTLTISGAAADSATVGTQLRAAFVTEQTSGSIASFTDGADGVPVKDLVVNITPAQSGTGDPSPTNIRPITGFDTATVYVDGKNILRYRSNMPDTHTTAGITFEKNNDGSITISGTGTTTGGFILTDENEPNPFQPGETYHFCLFPDADIDANLQLYVDGTSRWMSQDRSYTFPDSFETVYIRIRISSTTVANDVTVRPFVSLESEYDGVYEPYKGTTYPVSLSSAGTVYGGTLDVASGMLTVTHAVRDMGAMSWVYETDGTYPVFRATIGERRVGTDSDGIVGTCSIYTFYRNATAASLKSNLPNLHFGFQTTNTWTVFRDDSYTNAADFKAAVTGQLVYFELAQPVSYQLTPTEVKSLLANNNIWSDTGSVASCEYRADTKLYIEHLTTPDGDMVADANITSGSYFMVNNNLYLATAAIASGASIVPGTNCTLTNLASALNAINS